MDGRVQSLNAERSAELEIVATVACPVVGGQKEAAVNLGRNFDVVVHGLVGTEQVAELLGWVKVRALLIRKDFATLDPDGWRLRSH